MAALLETTNCHVVVTNPDCSLCQGQTPSLSFGQLISTVCSYHQRCYQSNYNAANPDNPLVVLKAADLAIFHHTISQYIGQLLNQIVEITQFYHDCSNITARYLPQAIKVYQETELAEIEATVIKLQRYRQLAKLYHCVPVKLPQLITNWQRPVEILPWSGVYPKAVDTLVVRVRPAQAIWNYLTALVKTEDLPRLYQSLQAAYQISLGNSLRRHHLTVLTGPHQATKLALIKLLRAVLGQDQVAMIDWTNSAAKLDSYGPKTKQRLLRRHHWSNQWRLKEPSSLWLLLPQGLGLAEEINILPVASELTPQTGVAQADLKDFLVALAGRESKPR